MSNYDKRRIFKVYCDQENYVLSSEAIDNEKLMIRIVDNKFYLNRISNDEWLIRKRSFRAILESYGCLGLMSFKEDSKGEFYLIFIKDANSVGSINQSEIFRITDVYVLMLSERCMPEENLNPTNGIILELRKFLCSAVFYFSFSYEPTQKFDLTLNSQLRHTNAKTSKRFFWNYNLQSPFRRSGVNTEQWLIKMICGCVEIKKVITTKLSYKALLISRLSCERVGTRFNCRGVNDDGNCANFVESEQTIYCEDTNETCSFMQIRGSVPLFWEQTGIQVGNHRIKVSRGLEVCFPSFERHFISVTKQYGNCLILNLLSDKGDENMLSHAYESLYKNCDLIDKITFVNFDYHKELKLNKTMAMYQSLLPKISKWLNNNDLFFHLNGANEMKQMQKSVIRTNCLDCLDRTNGTQLFISLEVLAAQLKELNVTDDKTINKFRDVYRQMWIISGDNISKIYAGTGAIQGKSMTQDISRSLTRAFQNNFLDGSKQDIIDMLLFNSKKLNQYNFDLIEKARVLLSNRCFKYPSYLLREMVSRYREYTEQLNCNVVVGTWNINGGLSFGDMQKIDLKEWLVDAPIIAANTDVGFLDVNTQFEQLGDVDIFAIGFEEIVDLNAANIVSASDENARRWLIKIQDALPKSNPKARDYVPVIAEPLQLVGVCLFVFVHKKHASFIRDVAVANCKTGLAGAVGNKGGVSIRFTFYNTSLCFVCSHFAAHQNQIRQRNEDFKTIYERTQFPQEYCVTQSIKSHEYVFWCGDLNYRIDMSNEAVRGAIKNCAWNSLIECDQLNVQKGLNNVFYEFNEAPLLFPPTYKFNVMEDNYDTSEKCRVPAWTDRILWRRRRLTKADDNDPQFETNFGGKCLYYGRTNFRYSDHRPVSAYFQTKINKVIPEKLTTTFKEILDHKGPFLSTVVVKYTIVSDMRDYTEDQTKSALDELKRKIIKRIMDFCSFRVFREFNNFLYLTYFSYQDAERTCLQFNNYELEVNDQVIYLSVELENSDMSKLINEELNHFMKVEHHDALTAVKPNVEVANLLGDDFDVDSQTIVKVPSQIHTEFSFNELQNFGEFQPTPSNDSNDLLQASPITRFSSYTEINKLNSDFTSLPTQVVQDPTAKATFHLFDLPANDFEKKLSLQNTRQPLNVPRRPPPPPGKQPPQPVIKAPQLIDIDSSENILIEIGSQNEAQNAPQISPPQSQLRVDPKGNNFIAHFSKSTPMFHKFDDNPFGDNFTNDLANDAKARQLDPFMSPIVPQVQALQAQAAPAVPLLAKPKIPPKPHFNADLLLLGDPGTPPPPPPNAPIRPSLNLKPPTKNGNVKNSDIDLLGDPGSPPPTPPPLF